MKEKSKTTLLSKEEIEKLRADALRVISPIRQTDANTSARPDLLFCAERAEIENLPEYFLVYFLFVSLLGFKNLGQGEKIAWSIPIDYKGAVFLLEHRKFGFGIFCAPNASMQDIDEIASLIRKGVKRATPYFQHLAEVAMQDSKLNVVNNSKQLYQRFRFFKIKFENKNKKIQTFPKSLKIERKNKQGQTYTEFQSPRHLPTKHAGWLGLAAIEAFFSWSEHIFIHLAILQGKIVNGQEVAVLAGETWHKKFKSALDIQDRDTKIHFDRLGNLRHQIRNFIAHGAFGKSGEAFSFHSGAGAVPIILDDRPNRGPFTLVGELAFDETAALKAIDDFLSFLWKGKLKPAKIYLHQTDFPLILPMAKNGEYKDAMRSVSRMNELVLNLSHQFYQAANMEW